MSESVHHAHRQPHHTSSASHEAHSIQHNGSVRTLLSWSAPGRPYAKRGREFYASVVLLVLLISIILFLFHEYVLIVTVFALTFLSLALSSVPPRNFHYRVSTQGIQVEDNFFLWKELYDFYFKRIAGMDVLVIRTEAYIPGELQVCLGDVTREHIKQVLVTYLPYREFVKKTFTESSGDWLARNFPLEKKGE